MIINDTIWFTTGRGETIGIILVADEVTKQMKAYIGVGEGHDEGLDVQIIQDWGAKVYPVQMETVLNHLKGTNHGNNTQS